MGGIGCPASLYLVATGIKKLKVIDGDIIEKTNLNRQLLYSLKNIVHRFTLTVFYYHQDNVIFYYVCICTIS